MSIGCNSWHRYRVTTTYARLMRLASVVVAVLLAGCAMGGRFRELHIGMPSPVVVERLGDPDGEMTRGDYRAMVWANRLTSSWSWDRADYWVLTHADSVVAYGPGQVRPGPRPNTLILIPAGN